LSPTTSSAKPRQPHQPSMRRSLKTLSSRISSCRRIQSPYPLPHSHGRRGPPPAT
jgi:hypothetical protein